MILHDITLINIGAYRGYNDFNLETSKEKPVILIGGENGAGKTTLLNAIKLGIFGAYSFGYKTENTEYYKRIRSTLNHEALRLHDKNFGITINFSNTEGFKTTRYKLSRSWTITKDQQLKENILLTANDILYNSTEIELFFSKLKEQMPPQILDLCLFDGEEIARIISQDKLSDYIRQVSKVAFNLDLFESLENDLNKYSNQSIDQSTLAKDEKSLLLISDEIQQKRMLLTQAKEVLLNHNVEISNLVDQSNILKRSFKNFGGLIKVEHEETIKKINELDIQRSKRSDSIKNFVATTLPFYLTKDLLAKTRNQMHAENKSLLFNKLDTELTEAKVKLLATKVNFQNHKHLKELILNTIEPDSTPPLIHNASFSESSIVENIFLQIQNNDLLKKSLDLLELNRHDKLSLKELRSKLKKHEENEEFSDMITKIESITVSIQQSQNAIDNQKSKINTLTLELEILIEKETQLKNSLRNVDKFTSSFAHSQAIIELSKNFRSLQLNKKLISVQVAATAMLKKIFRKENYISSLIIDPDTFELTLKNVKGQPIEKKTISAGEKQILLISIIWAIFKISEKKVPFIFDTLLGRLDKTHKAAILSEFIPDCGTQAIVLSTDSEIDEEHYHIINPTIAHSYRLEFNSELQETAIHKGYFSF